jgi:hypothetical protein
MSASLSKQFQLEATMDTQYIVMTPLHRQGEKPGKRIVTAPGQAVTLSDEDAKPLLACKAIRLPEVVATVIDGPTKGDKK